MTAIGRLYARLLTVSPAASTQQRDRLFGAADRIVRRDYATANLSLRAVAAELAISPRELQRAMRSAADTTFRDHVLEVRMVAARRLLQDGASSRQVASRVGYSSGAGFAKAFRRRYGAGPSAVRAASTGQP